MAKSESIFTQTRGLDLKSSIVITFDPKKKKGHVGTPKTNNQCAE